MRFLSIVTLVLISALSLSSACAAEGKQVGKQGIEVGVSPEKDMFLLGGPVGVVLVVKNNSEDDVECYMSYPEPMWLSFRPQTDGIAPKNMPDTQNLTFIPIRIRAGDTYQAVVYLNKYLDFEKAGSFVVAYEFGVPLTKLDSDQSTKTSTDSQTVTREGMLRLSLKEADERALDDELRLVAEGLSSQDRQKRLEAVQALCFLDTPLCTKYLKQVLAVRDSEVLAVRALGRFDSPEALTMIESVLENPDPGTVRAALDVLQKRKAMLDDEKIEDLLGASNHSVRYYAIEYLSVMGTARHAAMLEPLLADADPLVAEAARKCMAQLRQNKAPEDGRAPREDNRGTQSGDTIPIAADELRPAELRPR